MSAVVSINFISPGGWSIFVLNTGLLYKFKGANTDEQLVNVQKMSDSMQDGIGELNADMDSFLEVEGESGEEIVNNLFSDTVQLDLSGELVFLAEEEGGTLKLYIEDAGEALLEALGA